MVGSSDKKLLRVAGTLPQLIGSGCALGRKNRLSDIAVHATQPSVGHREFRIDFSGVLEKGHGGSGTCGGDSLPGGAVGLQGIERRGGSFLEWRVALFDGGERFANAGSELTGDLAESTQNVFFSRCLRLLLVEDISGLAALCA
jgi:hypothetical protein